MAHRSRWMDDDLDALSDLAARFFEKECAPHEERWAEQQHVDREVWNKAGELGLLCLSIPEEYGGGGGDFRHEAVTAIEQIRALAPSLGGPLHSTIVAHYLSNYASEDLKATWLPKMASGEAIGAIAMTEPGTGSDLQGIRTTAVRDGDEFVISGAKTFISNGYLADFVLVVARTDPEGGGQGFSMFLVETDREGFSRGKNLKKLGQHGQDTCELFYDEVRVPATNLVGEEGMGFVYLIDQLPQERLILAVASVATMEKAVELTLDYTRERRAFGKPIYEFQNTRFELAECATLTEVGWSFLDDCVEKQVAGTDRCLQLFGGYGYMEEYPIARIYADSRIQKIYGGTNEIMKEVIARSL